MSAVGPIRVDKLKCRHIAAVEDLFMNGVARTVAMASRCLLIVP